MISTPTSARLKGVIRFYSPDEGRGIIAAPAGDYHFQLTDVVGTLGPELGDRVAFSEQLVREQQFARKVVLERNPQFINGNRPSSGGSRPADLNRPRAPSKKTIIDPKIDPRSVAHMRCQGCRRVMAPKRVRSRSLFGFGASRWRCYCPYCKARQIETGRDAPRLARLLLGLLFVGLLIGGGLTLL